MADDTDKVSPFGQIIGPTDNTGRCDWEPPQSAHLQAFQAEAEFERETQPIGMCNYTAGGALTSGGSSLVAVGGGTGGSCPSGLDSVISTSCPLDTTANLAPGDTIMLKFKVVFDTAEAGAAAAVVDGGVTFYPDGANVLTPISATASTTLDCSGVAVGDVKDLAFSMVAPAGCAGSCQLSVSLNRSGTDVSDTYAGAIVIPVALVLRTKP